MFGTRGYWRRLVDEFDRLDAEHQVVEKEVDEFLKRWPDPTLAPSAGIHPWLASEGQRGSAEMLSAHGYPEGHPQTSAALEALMPLARPERRAPRDTGPTTVRNPCPK
jgi:hypothetical protein